YQVSVVTDSRAPLSFSILSLAFSFFFFQAEDGIRDRNVTGVQTCALPILRNLFKKARGGLLFIDEAYSLIDGVEGGYGQEAVAEIGRASCRERVWIGGVADA